MMTPSPLDTIKNLTAAINSGDVAAMIDFFEPDAALVVQALAGQPAQITRGQAAIGEAYKGFVSLKPTLRRQAQQVVEAGNIALHCSKWALNVTSPDGKKVEREGSSSDVLRKQPDGQWLIVIYNPYGTNMVSPSTS